MHCAQCGVAVSDTADFCHACGASTASKLYAQTSTKQTILYYIFGSVLILCGLFPLIFRGNHSSFSTYLDQLYSRYGYSSACVTVVSVVAFILTNIPNALVYLSCSLTIVSGFLLLRRCHNVRGILIVTAVAQFLSLLCMSILWDLLYQSPNDILSRYVSSSSDPYFLSDCVQILNNEPYLLNFYREVATARNIVTIVVVLSVVVFLSLARPHTENKRLLPTRVPHLGIVLMLLCLSLFNYLSSSSSWVTEYGNVFYSTYLISVNAFHYYCKLSLMLLLPGIAGLCILTPNVKKRRVVLPTVLTLLALGAVTFLLSNTLCRSLNVPSQYYSNAVILFGRYAIGATAILLGAFFWFRAVVQGRASVTLQIIIFLASLLVYFLAEYILPVSVGHSDALFWGFAVEGLFLAICSLCMRQSKVPAL